MFTGIVQAVGRVASMETHGGGRRLRVDTGGWTPRPSGRPSLGDSICVSGVCLSVTEVGDASLSFDVIRETLGRTTLGSLSRGDAVNLEPAVTPSQPMGGHFVQGHIDGLALVTDIAAVDQDWRVTIQPPTELGEVVVPKGSIAIEGVSLTLAAVHDDRFEVALIPTTRQATTLGGLKVNQRVNLEADIVSKTVVHALGRAVGSRADHEAVTMSLLREAGFA